MSEKPYENDEEIVLPKKKHRIRKLTIRILIFAVLIICLNLFLLVWHGVIFLNNPSKGDYPVRGADISHYQGTVNWDVFENQPIDFIFIKATEGSVYKDAEFKNNYENSKNKDLLVGFYHFFSFSSKGKDQADNFIDTVGELNGYLPPVINIEFYGKFKATNPEKDSVVSEINDFIETIKAKYGVNPIIYCTEKTFDLYISGEFDEECPIWIRSVYRKTVLDNNQWEFWQFSNRFRLKGYEGSEKFIDMNVFNGTLEELQKLIIK
ncbi:MAG: lysozyme [Clostridiales bacterium]|nr:lysozyme [Clostridiales bacterium]